ncbi:creatininase [Aureimonas endophytica]|uniref:Creatininase n=1 Tax=Aureimonas endophytica TaxID=2027858 RepID=A0A916ZYU8_9HYPH|nr:creatininase family protein [Aureimonas endophytica]GGE17385.1 creatininase [Aureimonas endophytica]
MASDRRVWWGDFTADEFRDLDPERVIALLPVAAVEQHGPHLGCGTDTTIAHGMLRTLAAKLPEDLDLRILPIQPVGKSDEHLYAPGTLHVPATVLIEHWTALGRAVARTGIRKLVIVTSHGGNEEVMGIVARQLRVEAGMLVVRSSWGRFGAPSGLFSEAETRYGIHGGDLETSLIRHFRPQAVEMARAENFASSVERDETTFRFLKATGPFAYSWIATDLNPQGVVGEAAKASAEKGRILADYQTDGFIELLRDIGQAPLPA